MSLKAKPLPVGCFIEVSVPTHFCCPISLELMKDPVTLSTGISYDRQSIETWLNNGKSTCPVTNMPLSTVELIPNHTIRRMIQDWGVKNRALGAERIPTPRIPITPLQVLEILSDVTSASRRGDCSSCLELVAKIKMLAKESENNKSCFTDNGAGRVLAEAFSEFAGKSPELSVLEQILSALTGMFPLDEKALWHITYAESLKSIVFIAERGDLAGRLNAVLVIKELVSSNEWADILAETCGLTESLVKLIKAPISPQATKVALVATFYLVTSNKKTATKFVEMGLVPLLLEILVDAGRSVTDKALGVVDGLLDCELGREEAYINALVVPVLVKRMLRVSEMSTEFAVSALWKICKNDKKKEEGSGCVVEALKMGAFQKILLLLQLGCSDATKGKATDLLKLLNASRKEAECVESMDFKGLKRPF